MKYLLVLATLLFSFNIQAATWFKGKQLFDNPIANPRTPSTGVVGFTTKSYGAVRFWYLEASIGKETPIVTFGDKLKTQLSLEGGTWISLAYMDGASSTTLITIYLSTDELGLPYAPSQAWRPEVIFKQAVRSLLLNARSVANLGIWVVVYIPALVFVWVAWVLVKRFVFKRKNPSQQ